jgi:hypothetical protein
MLARRLAPPCKTRTVPAGRAGTATSMSLGVSSTRTRDSVAPELRLPAWRPASAPEHDQRQRGATMIDATTRAAPRRSSAPAPHPCRTRHRPAARPPDSDPRMTTRPAISRLRPPPARVAPRTRSARDCQHPPSRRPDWACKPVTCRFVPTPSGERPPIDRRRSGPECPTQMSRAQVVFLPPCPPTCALTCHPSGVAGEMLPAGSPAHHPPGACPMGRVGHGGHIACVLPVEASRGSVACGGLLPPRYS